MGSSSAWRLCHRRLDRETLHPARFARHPLPVAEGRNASNDFHPLPRGEGGRGTRAGEGSLIHFAPEYSLGGATTGPGSGGRTTVFWLCMSLLRTELHLAPVGEIFGSFVPGLRIFNNFSASF